MIKTYKNFIIFFILIIVVLLFFLKKYDAILEHDQTDMLVSKNVEIITNEISNQKKHALSLAILLSKNPDIITLLKEKKRIELKQLLNNLLKTISSYTDIKNIQLQVHTKELKVFVRSWENKDTGLDLKSFRKGLVRVKKTKQPYVSNELGKRLNIKAISPIFDADKQYIGSIEVITDYMELQKRLRLDEINILPILDSKFLNIAKYLQNNKRLDHFVLIEKNYDKRLYDLLLKNPQLLSNKKFYHTFKNKIITLIPLGNINGTTPGYIVASFNKSMQNFNYLPTYKYLGEISSDMQNTYLPQDSLQKRKITIK